MANWNVEPEKSGLGLKCDGKKYDELFRVAFNATKANGAKLQDADAALRFFWTEFDKVSAPYHTGSAGIAKYSAPFTVALRKVFATDTPAKKREPA